MSKALIKKHQAALKELGLYKGIIDGIKGPKTTAAIEAFQHLHGLPATGDLNSAQARMLSPIFLPERNRPDIAVSFPHDDTESLRAYYGAPGQNHTRLELPYMMELAWKPGTFIDSFTINERCADAFYGFFEDIKTEYGGSKIRQLHLDQFGGSFVDRPIRGGQRLSTHAFAAAVDMDPVHNQWKWKRDKAAFARPEYKPMMEIATKHHITNMGKAQNYDYMHFQAAWL